MPTTPIFLKVNQHLLPRIVYPVGAWADTLPDFVFPKRVLVFQGLPDFPDRHYRPEVKNTEMPKEINPQI